MNQIVPPPLLKDGQETDVRVPQGYNGMAFRYLHCSDERTKSMASCQVTISLDGQIIKHINYLKANVPNQLIFFVDSFLNNTVEISAYAGAVFKIKLCLLDIPIYKVYKDVEFRIEAIPF
jgi:hypothetical protein